VLLGEPQRLAVAGGQQLVGGLVPAVDGAEAVDDVLVREVVGTRPDRLAGPDRGEGAALPLEAGPGGAVDRPRDPAPDPELGVRRVHDGLDVPLGRDVPLNALDLDIRSLDAQRSSPAGDRVSPGAVVPPVGRRP